MPLAQLELPAVRFSQYFDIRAWRCALPKLFRRDIIKTAALSVQSASVKSTEAEQGGYGRLLPDQKRTSRKVLFDTGEFRDARATQSWLEHADVKALSFAPSSPMQNGYAVSFLSRLRDEFRDLLWDVNRR